MMESYELIVTAMVFGALIPVVFIGVYWLCLDQAKRYTDKKLRESEKEMRSYVRGRK